MKDQDPIGKAPRPLAEHVRLAQLTAAEMVPVLEKHRDKSSWTECSLQYLAGRAHDELIELRNAIYGGDPERIRAEAIDLINLAAMILDRARGGA